MKSLIIGNGEVGASLYKILSTKYETYIKDIEELEFEGVKVLHICYPYFEGFAESVKEYQDKYKPEYTVIHSTVPIGTSKKCAAFHSPIRGVHPHLEQGILTMVKYLAPKNETLAKYFEEAGITITNVDNSDNTEVAKIFCTTYYGWNIIFEKEVNRFCKQHGLDFDMVYTDLNRTYNEGYTKLGMANVVRPVLEHVEGPIGGHCVLPNLKFLDSDVARFIENQNEKFKFNDAGIPDIIDIKEEEPENENV